jgi:hypothetical protein
MANTKLVFLSTEGNEELTTYLTDKNEVSICIDIPNAHDGFSVTFDKDTAVAFLEHFENEVKILINNSFKKK